MKKIELETPIDEMSEADLRETFAQVMEAHEANTAEFAEVQEEAEKAAEYSETIEELEADIEEAAGYFARKASTVTKLNEEILVERFSIDELVDLAAEADEVAEEAEFSEEGCDVGGCDGPDDCTDPECANFSEDEAGEESLFADKPSKAPVTSGEESRRDAAKSRLARIGGLSLE